MTLLCGVLFANVLQPFTALYSCLHLHSIWDVLEVHVLWQPCLCQYSRDTMYWVLRAGDYHLELLFYQQAGLLFFPHLSVSPSSNYYHRHGLLLLCLWSNGHDKGLCQFVHRYLYDTTAIAL